MLAAGMHFLHSSYTEAAAASGTLAAQSRLHTLLQLLGVAKATPLVVAKHILQLYKAGRESAAMGQEEHLRHLAFFADHLVLLRHKGNTSLLQQVQQHLLLQDSTQSDRPAAELYFSLGTDATDIQADVMGAGMHFIHSMYTAAGRGSHFEELLRALGVKQPSFWQHTAAAASGVMLHAASHQAGAVHCSSVTPAVQHR
jgi:hypothetical protein